MKTSHPPINHLCTLKVILMSSLLLAHLRLTTAFHAPLATSRIARLSSASYGRSCFRHVNARDTSCRMTDDSFQQQQQQQQQSSSSLPDLAPYQNPNNLSDQIFSALSGDGSLKITVCTIRNLLNEMMLQHSMNPVPADALGRAAMCALLASNGMQEEQMFQLSIKGDGAMRGCMVIVNGKGEARGFVGVPGLGGDWTLKEAVGKGTIQVVKNHPEWPRPYNGITAIRHGDIDRDVGIYLAESEQRSCALAAATTFNGILCTAAGGYLVERLPDCPPESMAHMERNLAKLVQIDGGDALPTNLLLEGKTPVDIAMILLDGLGMEPLNSIEPKALCECSEEKLLRSLRLLPREEVDVILREEGKVEARCQFCGRVYRMGPEEVERRLAEAKGDPSKDEDFGK
ncbi:hypothetical protein ACHAWX_003277 [Stephanocyclus meneghinianus]